MRGRTACAFVLDNANLMWDKVSRNELLRPFWFGQNSPALVVLRALVDEVVLKAIDEVVGVAALYDLALGVLPPAPCGTPSRCSRDPSTPPSSWAP